MNKCCLITGGDRGLGRAISTIFAQNGYDIVINYVKEEELANQLSADLMEKYSIKAIAIKADISNEEQVRNMFNVIAETFSKLDVVVNNAAISNDSFLLEKDAEDFEKVYKVNLVGAFLVSKYAKNMLSENSSIINITSTNGIDTNYTYSADYDASKAALISLTNNLAIELAPKVRVNAIAAGWMNTDATKDLSEDFRRNEEEKILLKRFADPFEVAEVVYFVASDKACYINKSIIRVDGGTNNK